MLVGLDKGATWAYLILFLVKIQSGEKYQKILLALKTPIYSKAESKKLLKLYLGKLGFSKKDIRDEVELYTKGMQDEESIQDHGINVAKVNIKNFTTDLNKLHKTKKNAEGKELSGEELQEYIEGLESGIKYFEASLTDQQKEKEKFKSDGWKLYLIKYINVYRLCTIKPKKRKVEFMKKHKSKK